MRKLKEVLRLRYELGLGQRQIARSCSIGQGTVYEYLKRAQAAGVTWPLPEGWEDRRLEEALFGPAPRHVYETRKAKPNFTQLHQELQQHPELTLQLAWEEYRQAHPDGYGYSRFCELYQQWRQQLDVVIQLSFEERFALLVDQQWNWKQNRALARRLAHARLRHRASVEDIDFRSPRGLDRALVRSLAHDSSWVRQHQNIFLLGPTGIGKSFLACALAEKGLPGWVHRLVHAGCATVPRPGSGPRRRQSAPPVHPAGQGRGAPGRRLGDGAPGGRGAPRLPGDL